MENQKYQRKFRNFFIYPAFQGKLLILMISLCLITPICLFIFQGVVFKFLKDTGQENNWPADHSYFVFVNQFQELFFIVLTSSVAISLLLVLVAGLYVSHKIAGPAVKIMNQFNSVAEGAEDREIVLRKGDFLQELADAYNKRFKKPV